ncbi:bifunctional DNA primase/polymerase [Brevibacterium moorei]|uniref:bifunctional DNA primase/polymerase n=1 Tax=Brevibacterium moorei TaxID=2968457 RepID=UPI00211C1EDE|nr:bifunctional DNA primase/polymerase [Brevibacterium sp. 68QC2CO]MCQ9386803.1 bifunctional DNA primase/polymerase [Brevibacterium sp. 68QC2CO]
MNTMLDAALELAGQGWKVFPCIPAGPKAKAPLTTNGFHDATTDPDQIRTWWGMHPGAMIGAPVPGSAIVLDVDPRHGGSAQALVAALGGTLPRTLTSVSGRGDQGHHLWYRHPGGPLYSRHLPEGVDLREGGRHYVIMPPSLHPATGRPYRWAPAPTGLATLPPAAIAKLRRPQAPPRDTARLASAAAAQGLVGVVAQAAEGERNQKLFWAACRAFERDDEHTVSTLFDTALRIGLSDTEAARTIDSARRQTGQK